MRYVKNTLIKGSRCLPLIAMAMSGCATVESGRVIEPGDQAGVSFTCQFANGDLAVSSSSTIGLNDGQRRSPAFFPRENSDPVVIEAGQPAPVPDNKVRPMEEEALQQLRKAVIGMREGENRAVELHCSITGRSIIRYNRIRTQHKERRMTTAEFKQAADGEPKVGAGYADTPGIPGRVTAVDGDTVTVKFSAEPGKTVDEFFGRGVISDDGDQYRVLFSAEKGDVVRSGYMVGRVVDVTDSSISVDFGDPFAGETLNCQVKVETVETDSTKTAIPAREGVARERLLVALATAAADGKKTVDIDADTLEADAAKPAGSAVAAAAAINGDLVTVNYTAALEDGAIFATTVENMAKDPERKKVAWYTRPQTYAPEEIMAGKQELLPGLGEAVLGMVTGGKKRVKLDPDKAFGPADPRKLAQFPCSRTMPRVIRMTAEEYAKQFSSFPVPGSDVELVPYFRSRVTEVTEREVALEALAKDGQTMTDSYGTVTVSVAGDEVTTTLKPLIGAQLPTREGTGIITASDGKTFTVDGNHPLAGKAIIIDLEVVKVVRAAELKTKPVEWIEEHEKGLAKAKEEGRPALLVLHADSCGYCKKLFEETIPDPRIGRLSDKFVWVKVNSDKEKKYYEQYGQSSFPMIVILKADGKVLKKIDGFRDARGLKAELDGV